MPNGKTNRVVRATALLFGEGRDDRIFLAHLVSIYAAGQDLRRPKISTKKGRGGSADGVAQDAHKLPGNYSRKLVKLDKDRPQEEIDEATRIAQRYKIQIVFSVPCIEGTLLSILEPGSSYANKSSQVCKRAFESKYILPANRGKMSEYTRWFTKDLLDEARQRVPELNDLISYIESC